MAALDVVDEQVMPNKALKNLGVVWKQRTPKSTICSVENGWWSTNDPIKVYVLPQRHFCRSCCDRVKKEDLYNVHPMVDKHHPELKQKRFKDMHIWFLEDGWKDSVGSNLIGDEWLKSISTII